jgi:myo-inositol 2-dehydrogenase/D-chiro-inositol 1-dehydrogenase
MGVGLGLIGAGRMGKVFAHTLAFAVAEARLLAVADVDPQAGQQAAARYGAAFHTTDYRELLARPDIEAVLVVTPTATHATIVQQAAAAGKHIFCEKPLAMTLPACDQAIAAVEKAGVLLQLGFMRRFDPAYVMAKQRIEAGEIGSPVMFRSTSRDPHRTSLEFARRENSGGMIMDMGVHDFDLARWLMGSEVVRLHSLGGCLAYPELAEVGDIDNAVIQLQFENGALGSIDLSRNAVYGYDIRTEVLGTQGGLLIGNLQQTATLVLTRQGVRHDTMPYFMERFGAAYAAEIRDFVDCVLTGRQPGASGPEARRATAIGLAATRSLDEGRPVDVQL